MQRAHIVLAGAQGDQSAIAVVGDGDNSSSMRRVKSGAYGAIIQAAGGGGGRHSRATGVALDQDRQAQIGSSKAITQPCLSSLGIGELLKMFRFTGMQALLQRHPLRAFFEQQTVKHFGLLKALLHQLLCLFGKHAPVAPGLQLP